VSIEEAFALAEEWQVWSAYWESDTVPASGPPPAPLEGDSCKTADQLAQALLALREEMAKTTAERDMFHQLVCVVAFMDSDDTTGTVKVFRSCMPSLTPLFRDGDGDALCLSEAADRAIDTLAARTVKP
jgi:hypothetical protein